jgi:hypothetical protein
VNNYQHAKALKITILIPGVNQPLSRDVLERNVANDVLDWIHSDDSGLAGAPDTLVAVELTDDRIPAGRWWEKDYHETGEQILLAHDSHPFRASLGKEGGRK